MKKFLGLFAIMFSIAIVSEINAGASSKCHGSAQNCPAGCHIENGTKCVA